MPPNQRDLGSRSLPIRPDWLACNHSTHPEHAVYQSELLPITSIPCLVSKGVVVSTKASALLSGLAATRGQQGADSRRLAR
jgi:hypothetical protein